ncbi:hypothetical protein Gotur_021688 [Gossypium turneri]
MLENPRLSALNEDKECLTKTIDKCQNNSSYYQIQSEIDLMAKAKDLLQQKDQFKTNGRRILAYHSYLIKEKDDEDIQLLKKIVEIDIEDFPSNILQQIRITSDIIIQMQPTKIAIWIDDDASSDGSNH